MCWLSQIERIQQKPSDEQIHNQNNNGGDHECRNRGAAYAGGSSFHSKSLMTTHSCNDEPENDWFRESHYKVSKNQRMNGACPELFCAEMERDRCHRKSTQQPRTIPHCHEQGEHQHHRQQSGVISLRIGSMPSPRIASTCSV